MLEFEILRIFFGHIQSFIIIGAAAAVVAKVAPDTFRLTKEHIRETIERQESRNDK